MNPLLDVGFNREVAEENALYFTKGDGNLAALINKCDHMNNDEIAELGVKVKRASLTLIAGSLLWTSMRKCSLGKKVALIAYRIGVKACDE